MLEKCWKYVLYFIYLLVVLAGSVFVFILTISFPFSFPDDSIFKNDRILVGHEYRDISYYPNLEMIYQNYSNDIYYQRKYDLSFSYNISVIPLFMLLTLIFAANFICCDKNKTWYAIIGIITIISQVVPLINNILKTKKKKEDLPELSNDYYYSEDFEEIFDAYEDYKEGFPNSLYITVIALLGVHAFIWFFLLILKKEENLDNKEEKKKKASCIVMFHFIFGIFSAGIFIFSPYLYYNCKNRYSDNFFPNNYTYTKTQKIRYYYDYSIEDSYIVETYDYKEYYFLGEIYNIYYKNSSKENEKKKIKMNLFNFGDIYFFAAVAGCPILSIISFILLSCFKCNGKFQPGFIVFDILSMLLKVYIIFWPFIWIKDHYREDLLYTKEETQHIIDDYINFSKCRNKFPIIIIIECVYICFEIIIFIVSFFGNKDNSENIQVQAPQIIVTQQIIQPVTESVRIIERVVKEEIPRQTVKLLFKDNKNKTYELEVDTKRRFNDILNELIGKYGMNRNEIKSIVLNNRYLYLKSNNPIQCFDTIEQLKIDNNTGFIYIIFEDTEVLNLNKTRLAPLPKLHFCIINLGNRKIDVDRREDLIFSDALENLRKKDTELNDIIFESMFYYERGAKIKLEKEDFNKKISELNIPKEEIIFIKINYKDNTPINFEFVWVNENNKRYQFTSGKKETFHSVAVEFMGRFDDFLDNIITQFYIFTSNINEDDLTLFTRESTNILQTDNPNTFKKIIETENKCQFENLEKLGIDNGTEIFFETRKNIDFDPIGKSLMKSTMRDQMIFFNNLKEQGVKILTFKTTFGNDPYIIQVNENEKFEEAIFSLKKDNPLIFKNKEIKAAMLNGDNLMREEKRLSRIKDLQIKETDCILINIGDIGK